jgi:lipoprotein NlpD
MSVPADGAKVLPGAENAGKPGYYTVKPGDTMIRIGLDTGPELARHRALERH